MRKSKKIKVSLLDQSRCLIFLKLSSLFTEDLYINKYRSKIDRNIDIVVIILSFN